MAWAEAMGKQRNNVTSGVASFASSQLSVIAIAIINLKHTCITTFKGMSHLWDLDWYSDVKTNADKLLHRYFNCTWTYRSRRKGTDSFPIDALLPGWSRGMRELWESSSPAAWAARTNLYCLDLFKTCVLNMTLVLVTINAYDTLCMLVSTIEYTLLVYVET